MTEGTMETPNLTRPSSLSLVSSNSALAVEIAKCLKLVAPASMGADAQLTWIASAVDALEGIRPDEVAHVSAELRRSVTRPAQIVPEIARLVSARRSNLRSFTAEKSPSASQWKIDRKAHDLLMAAKTLGEIEAAKDWERRALSAAGLPVHPYAEPLSRAELDGLPDNLMALGLKRGLLERRDGKLHERPRADFEPIAL